MRILYTTTVGVTMRFFETFVRELLDAGHTVDIACNCIGYKIPECYEQWGCKIYQIPWSRSPLRTGNLTAVRRIREIARENNYDLVHCHTPIAAACTRLACRGLRKGGLKLFYTAHGFHFYDGAPLKNWLIYFPVEWLCAHWTDTLITINRDDYDFALRRLRAHRIEYVPGVGIDTQRFCGSAGERAAIRGELGVPQDAELLLSVGELNENKNHETAIKAVAGMNVYYAIVGSGGRRSALESLVSELGLSERVKFLGFRADVDRLYCAADLFVFPSFREGLSVSLMEAMAAGLPCAVSRIRGNVDLIDEDGGTLFDPHSADNCRAALSEALKKDAGALGEHNRQKIRNFSSAAVNKQMTALYSDL